MLVDECVPCGLRVGEMPRTLHRSRRRRAAHDLEGSKDLRPSPSSDLTARSRRAPSSPLPHCPSHLARCPLLIVRWWPLSPTARVTRQPPQPRPPLPTPTPHRLSPRGRGADPPKRRPTHRPYPPPPPPNNSTHLRPPTALIPQSLPRPTATADLRALSPPLPAPTAPQPSVARALRLHPSQLGRPSRPLKLRLPPAPRAPPSPGVASRSRPLQSPALPCSLSTLRAPLAFLR